MGDDLRDYLQYLVDRGYKIELIGFQDEETGESSIWQISEPTNK